MGIVPTGLWGFGAQQLAGPPVDEMYSFASWTVDGLVVVLWHFIAIIQPVLNHHLGRGAGEKDWAAHPEIVALSETLTLRYLNWGSLLTFEPELDPGGSAQLADTSAEPY